MYGDFYYGKVVENEDPQGRGRVEVEIDDGADTVLVWAQVLVGSAGNGYGVQFLPESGERVLVVFPKGRTNEAVVLGSLFTGATALPEAEVANKVIKTKEGHAIRMNDQGSSEGIQIESAAGHRIVIDDDKGEIEIAHSGGSKVTVSSTNVQVEASGTVEVSASRLEVNAASVDLNAATVSCSGILNAPNVIATTVIASTYTNGAGNIW